MAMHNFGPNSSQHEHQVKREQQTGSGTDPSSWQSSNTNSNNNNNNNSNFNNNNEGSSNASNNDHVDEAQQTSRASSLNDHKALDSSKNQASRSNLNRQQQQQQQHQPQLQSQSQQYHGVFSPQIPAILHSSLASRVDQIIRTTLNDSPAYTPPTSRNNNNNTNTNNNTSNNAGNNINVQANTSSSNMPIPSSSSSLIFSTPSGPVSTTSASQNISNHSLPNSSSNLMSTVTTTAPMTSIYGSTLSNMGDNMINATNSSLVAKTSPSHSALAAAAALQSLNQSHVQRSQQQQMAHTQPSPYTSGPGSSFIAKPPSNGNGTPVPQAAHGGNIHQISKLNMTSIPSMDQPGILSFPSDHPNIGSLNFSSRLQNTSGGNNLGSKISGQPMTMGLPNMGWQDQAHSNGMVPRLPPLHGLNGPLPPYATSSSQSSYGIMNPQISNSLNSNTGNMIGHDSDTLSKLNSMKSSLMQNNPMQFRDEKSLPMSFPTLLSNKQNHSSIDGMGGPVSQHNSLTENSQNGVSNERLVVFAYNLLSQVNPLKQQPKKVVHLDDDMKNAIQRDQFYSKYSHIASGILTNQMIVPNFSIIDYLRKDRFNEIECDYIERVHGSLAIPDLLCLMELVRQRSCPSDKSTMELGKTSHFPDIGPMGVSGISTSGQLEHPALSNLHHNSPQKGVSYIPSSPNRSDILGPQGIDRSRRSSQSPSDISRSQAGTVANNAKFSNAHSIGNVHQHQSSIINNRQFTTPMCPPSQQPHHQQHTSPQANRSSPFQTPLSVGPNQSLPRPPRSHSTFAGLGPSALGSPYGLSSPHLPPPPAAHQNSSRPNPVAMSMQPAPAHSGSSNPPSAHHSTNLPGSLKPADTSSRSGPKGDLPNPSPYGVGRPGGKDSLGHGHIDYQSPMGRLDLDPNRSISIQNSELIRQHEFINRDLIAKQSGGTHYLQSSISGSVPNLSEPNRHHELMDSNIGIPSQMNQINMGNYAMTAKDQFNRNLAHGGGAMPPPSLDQRQLTNDLSARNMNVGPNLTTNVSNDVQMKQYNALMAAYQQQMIMSGKVGEGSPGLATNVPGQVPAYMVMNQPCSQRPHVGEPMHVDILQQVKHSQIDSPKQANQRSIITGSGSAAARKNKKPKPSPPMQVQSVESRLPNDLVEKTPFGPGALDTGGDTPVATNLGNNGPAGPSNPTIGHETNQPMPAHASTSISDHCTGTKTSNATDGMMAEKPACGPSVLSGVDGPLVGIDARTANIPEDVANRGELGSMPESLRANDVSLNPLLESPASTDIANSDRNQANKSETSVEIKSNTSKSDGTVINTPADQPSKYQKLFTKKAWLKNYDLEDQARSNGEIPTTDETMTVSTRATAKVDDKSPPAAIVEVEAKDDKAPNPVVKPAKNSRSKVESKKKVKEGKTKKAAQQATKTNKATPIKATENDSEETNASTSDLDDTDETDSLKSTNDKKLRRMPRRKVKLSSEREISDSANKTKLSKESSDKDMVARGRTKKDKVSNLNSESNPTKRKYNSDDESIKQKTKKSKESISKHSDKCGSPLVSKSKKRSGDKFLQTQPCYEILPKSARCLECRRVRQSSLKGDKTVQSKQASKTNWDDFCRFFEFRKLRYNKSAQMVVAGFSEAADAKESDMRLWLPLTTGEPPKNINYNVAKFILSKIGDEFCKLVLQERAALESYETNSGKRTTWKRAVYGLRELCDVCSTTLFNCHYVCDRCGFVVCIDCHETRTQALKDTEAGDVEVKKDPSDTKISGENNHTDTEQTIAANKKSKKDTHGWNFCAKNEEHSDDRLTLTKIIAGNCLEEVWTLLHEIRDRLNLGECCCKKPKELTGVEIEEVEGNEINGEVNVNEHEGSHSTLKGLLLASSDSPMNGPVDIKHQVSTSTDATSCKTTDSTDLQLGLESDFGSEDDSRQVSAAIEGCIASLAVEGSADMQVDSKTKVSGSNIVGIDDTSSTLCHGDLLVLSHSHHKDNIRLFRDHWRHGKPVLVRGVHDKMNIDMWLPQFFLGKFGDYRSDLVDCRNGDIHRQSMRKYWDGFEPSSNKKKPKEDVVPGHIPPAHNEEPSAISTSYYSGSALWRLKDWPPGQDFNEILPEHYDDFMNNLPLKSYTTRTGKLNLACRLPKEMLKPDLGPKMYSAYGTTKFPERGTTNLHLDISDAVNVMVYVGGAMPFKQGATEHGEIYDSTISECYVDSAMKEQIRQQKLIPGALWHIFKPTDVEKIRDFLNKVSDECKISHEKRIDPIHDQIWYLDQNLLDRLQEEHGVKSYPILQCMGDAILIPAGAPHQVKNLQNCIKVANDFVSPENIRYCLKLTNEFRNLPETHINQEDKLQIKNIMYHSVKESIQYIKMFESGKITKSYESSDEDGSSDAESAEEVKMET